jgi:alanyl-tRNA synthetase
MITHLVLRQLFFDFFQQKSHKKYGSSSLLPSINEENLLFTNSGMVQFKGFFQNITLAPNKSVISIQKCLRINGKHDDIENVGKTKRHQTFFEMLGNFSFGSYGKEEAINLIWEFLTSVLNIPTNKLIVTIYKNDEESLLIWGKKIHLDKIVKCDDDNFWKMGNVGPCGPCSEIFFDLEGINPVKNDFINNSERFLEIWNIVFMEYFDDGNKLTKLKNLCIDTGGGMERILSILQKKESNFQTDVLLPIIESLRNIINIQYESNKYIFNVCSDHIRSIVFLITEGVLPSNEGRGFVLRKLIRRAVRIYSSHIKTPILYQLVNNVVNIYQDVYFNDKNICWQDIEKLIKQEEEVFLTILEKGLKWIDEILEDNNQISGKDAFLLQDSFGLPIEITMEYAKKKNFLVDVENFDILMDKQKKQSVKKTIQFFIKEVLFTGYHKYQEESKILAIINKDFIQIDKISEKNNKECILFFDKTCFFGEGGGQVGDTGFCFILKKEININDHTNITNIPDSFQNYEFFGEIIDTKIIKIVTGEQFLHYVNVLHGHIDINNNTSMINLLINKKRRMNITRHHSSAHIIGNVIEKLKGPIEQRGSLITENFGRIDIHCSSLSFDEIVKIENMCQEIILNNIESNIKEISSKILDLHNIKKLPGVVYPDIVRVVAFGNHIKELCCGTHVNKTGDLGFITINKIQTIGSGIIRIIFTAGNKAMEMFQKDRDILKKLMDITKTTNIDLLENKIINIIKESNSPKNIIKKEIMMEKVIINNIIIIAGDFTNKQKMLKVLHIQESENKEKDILLMDIVSNCFYLKDLRGLQFIKLKEIGIKGGGSGVLKQGSFEKNFINIFMCLDHITKLFI